MTLVRQASGRVEAVERPKPVPGSGQLLIKVRACGVCRTDLHVIDGDLPDTSVPIVPGHEIVGVVEGVGEGVHGFSIADRIGVPWLGKTCGVCQHCRSHRENLCAEARFTGYQIDGGYAEYTLADQEFCFRLPDEYEDAEAAPLLCAGAIGYRSYRMTGDARRIGIYGFGAAAHIVAQIARYDGREVYAFTSPGDDQAMSFARQLGVAWAGPSTAPPPQPLDAAIIFAPVGSLVPEALARTAPGGTVVCAGIHMTDIPSFPYRLLWQERVVRSVANLTRQDAGELLALAPRIPVRTHVKIYPLREANRALQDLRQGLVQGAAVLVP
jgi:propanol-preferring alcohol dehydrogenase